MIFPDEKMIEEMAHKAGFHAKDCSCGGKIFYSDISKHYRAGFTDAINHIKSAASGDFEAWLKKQPYGRLAEGEYCPKFRDGLSIGYQAAVISTAAKYEEKLREKDVELELKSEVVQFLKGCNISAVKKFNAVLGCHDETKLENEQLKAAVNSLSGEVEKSINMLKGVRSFDYEALKDVLAVRLEMELKLKNAQDLLTKINKHDN